MMTLLAGVPRLLRLRLARRLRSTSVATRGVLLCLAGLVFILMMSSSPQPLFSKSGHENIDDVIKAQRRQLRLPATELTVKSTLKPIPIDLVQLSPQLEQLAAKKISPRQGVDPGSKPVCSGSGLLPPPEDFEEPMKWQPVSSGGSSAGFVFSAHLDQRFTPTPGVVIVGLSLSPEYAKSSKQLYCRMWYRQTGSNVVKNYVTQAQTRYSFESHGRRYTASFHTCFLVDNESVPFAVSVTEDPRCDQPKPNTNLLKVITSQLTPREMTSPGLVNFTVCVTPFNYRYDRVRQLAEMIEVNRMYGAQRFVFYNYSSTGNVTRLLDSYRKWYDGALIEVIQWPLPMPVDVWPRDPAVTPEVHYFGQLAALNDCLYRSIGRSTFVVNTDLDEFIVPRQHHSWAAMLNDVTTKLPDASYFPAVYMMQNVFFRTDWPKDSKFVGSELITLETTEREQNIFPFNSRSKIIAWTKATWMVGVHAAVELCANCNTVYVEETDALLHHYRLWEDDPNQPRPASTIDRHMHQYADTIRQRTKNVHLSLAYSTVINDA